MTIPNQFKKICDLDDVWKGEMDVFELDGQEVLIIHTEGGEVRAYDPVCPHAEFPLVDGEFENCILTCSAHLWQFDVITGEGVNPTGVSLNSYPVKVQDEEILIILPLEKKAGNT